MLPTLENARSVSAAWWWLQLLIAAWIVVYILNPRSLPGGNTAMHLWPCVFVLGTVAMAYVAEPWFAAMCALGAMMALCVTRRRLTWTEAYSAPPRGLQEFNEAFAHEQQIAAHSAQLDADLGRVDGREITLEETLVNRFTPLGKSFLSGLGAGPIRRLPVGLLP